MGKIFNYIAVIVLALSFSTAGALAAQAADGGSYESNGKVGFYGEYVPKDDGNKDDGIVGGEENRDPQEKGGDNDNLKPDGNDGQDGANGSNGSNAGGGSGSNPSSEAGGTSKQAKVDGTLPQTGVSSFATYVGIALLSGGILFLLLKNRKSKSYSEITSEEGDLGNRAKCKKCKINLEKKKEYILKENNKMKNITVGATAAVLILALASGAVVSTDAKAADGGSYESNGKVGFEANTSTKPVDPIDPTNPTNPPVKPVDPTDPNGPNPGTPGPLSIDYASSLDFGLNEISAEDEIYYANPQKYGGDVKDSANYVQVTDRRGTNAGWTLSVKQDGQFKNDSTQNKELTGTKISLAQGIISTPTTNAKNPSTFAVTLDPTGNAASKIIGAKTTEGSGTFASSFGTLEEVSISKGDKEVKEMKNTGVKLEVPGATPKDAVEYTTKLTWTLTDAPEK